MIILHFSDLHDDARHQFFMKSICDAAKPDLVAISGDMTSWAMDAPGNAEVLKRNLAFIEALNLSHRVAFCSGNHEAWTAADAAKNLNVFCPDCASRMLQKSGESLIVSCFPYSDNDVISRDVLGAEFVFSRKNREATRVWLHHDPPWRSLTAWQGAGYAGSVALLHALKEKAPHFVLSGHYHMAPFNGGKSVERCFSTICCNPGSTTAREGDDATDTPPYITIDTLSRTAVWTEPQRLPL